MCRESPVKQYSKKYKIQASTVKSSQYQECFSFKKSKQPIFAQKWNFVDLYFDKFDDVRHPDGLASNPDPSGPMLVLLSFITLKA